MPASRAAEQRGRQVRSSGWRPGTPAARAARGRGRWCPSPAPLTRGWAAMARTSKIAVGVSTIAHTRRRRRPGGVERGRRPRRGARAESTLGITTDGRAGTGGGGDVVGAPRAWPGRCSGSSARGGRTRPTSAAATACVAGRLLGVGGDGVLEVEDDARRAAIVFAFSSARALAAGMYSTERSGRTSSSSRVPTVA